MRLCQPPLSTSVNPAVLLFSDKAQLCKGRNCPRRLAFYYTIAGVFCQPWVRRGVHRLRLTAEKPPHAAVLCLRHKTGTARPPPRRTP